MKRKVGENRVKNSFHGVEARKRLGIYSAASPLPAAQHCVTLMYAKFLTQ